MANAGETEREEIEMKDPEDLVRTEKMENVGPERREKGDPEKIEKRGGQEKIDLPEKIDPVRTDLPEKIDLVRTEDPERIGPLEKIDLLEKISPEKREDPEKTDLLEKIDPVRTDLPEKTGLVRTEDPEKTGLLEERTGQEERVREKEDLPLSGPRWAPSSLEMTTLTSPPRYLIGYVGRVSGACRQALPRCAWR